MEPEAAQVEDETPVEAHQESPLQQNSADTQDDVEPMEQEESSTVIQEESEAEPQVTFLWSVFGLVCNFIDKNYIYVFL